MKNALLVALLAVVAAGCSKSDSDSSKPAASILGEWRPVQMVSVSTPLNGSPASTIRVDAPNFGPQKVGFNADGTAVNLPGSGVGTYTFNAPTLKYQGTSQGQTATVTKTVTKLTADSLVWVSEPTTTATARNTATWRFAR